MLVAFFILHFHSTNVGRDADMVGNKDQHRVGIGILAILFNGRKFFFIRAAAKKTLHAAHKEHLKRGHERGRAGAIKNFGKIIFSEIELEHAEVTEVCRNQVFENGVPKAFAEESLIAHEHVRRTQLARFDLADKPIRLEEGPHHKFSASETIVVTSNSSI